MSGVGLLQRCLGWCRGGVRRGGLGGVRGAVRGGRCCGSSGEGWSAGRWSWRPPGVLMRGPPHPAAPRRVRRKQPAASAMKDDDLEDLPDQGGREGADDRRPCRPARWRPCSATIDEQQEDHLAEEHGQGAGEEPQRVGRRCRAGHDRACRGRRRRSRPRTRGRRPVGTLAAGRQGGDQHGDRADRQGRVEGATQHHREGVGSLSSGAAVSLLTCLVSSGRGRRNRSFRRLWSRGRTHPSTACERYHKQVRVP